MTKPVMRDDLFSLINEMRDRISRLERAAAANALGANGYVVQLRRSTAFTVTDGFGPNVTWEFAATDPMRMWNGSTSIIIPVPGSYLVTVSLYYRLVPGLPAGNAMGAGIVVNGQARWQITGNVINDHTRVTNVRIVTVRAGDIIHAQAWQWTGANRVVEPGVETELAVALVAPSVETTGTP